MNNLLTYYRGSPKGKVKGTQGKVMQSYAGGRGGNWNKKNPRHQAGIQNSELFKLTGWLRCQLPGL